MDAKGTFEAANRLERVDVSVWNNDSELSEVILSNENPKGERFMIFQCGMYRKLEDEYSQIQLKVGESVNWVFGYKLFDSKGDYTPNIIDGGSGALLVLESATSLALTSLASVATLLAINSF